MIKPKIFHIRKPLASARGSQFYKDRNPAARNQGTYCGADVTSYDINWKDPARPFGNLEPCQACREARKSDPKFNRYLTT